jgi:hypothetical protein
VRHEEGYRTGKCIETRQEPWNRDIVERQCKSGRERLLTMIFQSGVDEIVFVASISYICDALTLNNT